MRLDARPWMLCASIFMGLTGCYASSEPGCAEPASDPPAAARSGSWLAYSTRPAQEDLPLTLVAVRSGDLQTEVLEEGARWVQVAWSPTERLLAASITPESPPGSGIVLFRFDDDGVVERRWLWRAPEGDTPVDLLWSPDGRYLAHRTHGAVDVLRIHDMEEGGAPVTVMSSRTRLPTAWSPTGEAIAIEAVPPGGDAQLLYVARADRGFVPRAVALPDGVHHPHLDVLDVRHGGWSPDGRWLAFRARHRDEPEAFGFAQAFVVNEHGMDTVRISPALNPVHPSAGPASWSPDSALLTYAGTSASSRIPVERERYVVDLTGGTPGAPRRLASTDAKLAWLSGRRLLSLEPSVDEVRGAYLEVTASGEVETIEQFRHPGRCLSETVSLAPLRAVLGCRNERDRRSESLLVWDPSRASPTEVGVLQNAWLYERGWSPDASRFAFIGHAGGAFTLFELRFPSAELHTIHAGAERWTNSNAHQPEPWNPDGSAYYFRLQGTGLALRDVETNETHILAAGEGARASALGWERVAPR